MNQVTHAAMRVQAFLLALFTATAAHAAGEHLLLRISDLNGDGRADTLYGVFSARGSLLPERIAWNRGTDGSMRETRIHLPAWQAISTSVVVDRVDADSVDDILLYLRGTTRHGDTMLVLLLAGRSGLDSVVHIDLGETPSPGGAHVRSLESDRLLTEPALRDPTRVVSHLRGSVEREAPPSDTLPHIAPRIAVRPNPVTGIALLEGRHLDPGEYRLRVLTAEGRVVQTREIPVHPDGMIDLSIDLRSVPSGYYLVELRLGESMIGTAPLVLLH